VAEAASGAGLPVTVIELNARANRPEGAAAAADPIASVVGDAARPEILVRAGIMTARMLVVTIPETASMRTIIRHARELAPGLHIVARGRYNLFVEDVRRAGADDVVDEESVTGRELAGIVLRHIAVQDAPD